MRGALAIIGTSDATHDTIAHCATALNIRTTDGWRGEHQMTEPITDENFYNEHAALLGHVALAWNDCHSVVLSIFHTLSGVSWQNASSIFLALKSDHDRRETTLALMHQVLSTDNDRTIKEWGTQLL